MACTVTVRIKYDDNSKSYAESFYAADKHPSPEVIKDCEKTVMQKWTDMGGTLRGMQIHTTVK